jgi:flavin-dependent thymidylate synthase
LEEKERIDYYSVGVSMHENKVELIGFYGSDETHALSAWTSTSRELTDEKRGRMDKLIKMLGESGHHTVFEKSLIHYLITTDVSAHIHILKHRINVSVNGESARYKELKDDKFYIPQDWAEDEQALLIKHCEESLKKYHQCLARLVEKGMPKKRAKESARFYLPYANQLTADVSFNFRSLMHFMGLRNSEEAQLEIREIAAKMLELVRGTGKFDMSLDAFGW